MNINLKSLRIFGFFFVYSMSSFASNFSANIDTAVPVGAFSVGIGSTVNLKSSDKNIAGPAVFLGTSVRPDGSDSFQM